MISYMRVIKFVCCEQVDWDAYSITDADELYHAAWGNVKGTAVYTTPLPVRKRFAALLRSLCICSLTVMGALWGRRAV